MRGRKPAPAVVVSGPWAGSADEKPDANQPDWAESYDGRPEEWGPRRAKIAEKRFAALVASMTAKGTLDQDNLALVEMAAGAYADWKLAEAHVNHFGPIVPAPNSGTPMKNPFKTLADGAFKRMTQAEDRLGIPPVERGRATKAGGKGKKANAADAYLKNPPAWAPSAKKQ
jgi:phage terminase small subunit